ncbi:MAG: hypothetical protein ACOX6D_05840, partial [Thermoguttaceae bacterium]
MATATAPDGYPAIRPIDFTNLNRGECARQVGAVEAAVRGNPVRHVKNRFALLDCLPLAIGRGACKSYGVNSNGGGCRRS